MVEGENQSPKLFLDPHMCAMVHTHTLSHTSKTNENAMEKKYIKTKIAKTSHLHQAKR